MAENRVAIIPARGNSKGIPRKNLLPVGGRPLLAYTVDAARSTGIFDEVIVSSESPEILAYAAKLGAVTIERPEQLSRDDVHSVHVVLDVIGARGYAPESIVAMLLPTSPLRTRADILHAYCAFRSSRADSLVSVYRDAKHLLQLRRISPDGLLVPLVDGEPNVQRQEIGDHYVVNGSIYFSTVEALVTHGSFHRGRVMPFLMDRSRSVDVNTVDDVADVERMLSA